MPVRRTVSVPAVIAASSATGTARRVPAWVKTSIAVSAASAAGPTRLIDSSTRSDSDRVATVTRIRACIT